MTDYESVGCAFKSRRARLVSQDERWMRYALEEARRALEENEVPVGCVIVMDERIIGRGHNRTEALCDPTAHAEIVALSAAGATAANWRLVGGTVYTTIEPCLMCSGALVLARPARVVFGARDPKFGCLGSRYDIAAEHRFNHQFAVTAGVCADEAAALVQEFFRRQRRRKRASGAEKEMEESAVSKGLTAHSAGCVAGNGVSARRDGRVDEGA